LSLVLALPAQDYPPAFPRTNATKLLETDRIVVWDIVWPQGQPTAMHRHLYDQVGTYYQRGGRHITNLDGTSRDAMTEVGSLSNTRKGTTHIEEGTTDPPLKAVFIEIKQDATAATTSGAKSEPPSYCPRESAKNVLDDDRVAVWDCGWTPRAVAVIPVIARDTVIVWLADGRLRASSAGSPLADVALVAGKMEHLPRGTVVTRQIVAGQPRAMIFEFK
jgi:hypothetical protein